MSLKEALKPKTTQSTSLKNPAYYNQEKKLFISDMANNPLAVVRITAAGNDHIPATVLKQMLKTETDNDILKVILMNARTPIKAVTEFSDDDRSLFFDDDEEVTEYLKARMNTAVGGSGDTE